MANKVVIATTTFYPKFDIRSSLAIQTIVRARNWGYEMVVVDGGSCATFLEELSSTGLRFYQEEVSGMGKGRRQAKRIARKISGKDGIVVWMEPEKLPFVDLISSTLLPIVNGVADLVIPARYNLDSYPPEQQHAEIIGNLAVSYILGRNLDMWFGPRVMNSEALQVFLDYDGRYGDTWDSIQVPVLECLAKGLRVVSASVDYRHPREQTMAEVGDLSMLLKRVDQLKNIVPGLMDSSVKLGLKPPL